VAMTMALFKCVNLYPSVLIKSKHLILIGLTSRSPHSFFSRVNVLPSVCSRDTSTFCTTTMSMRVPVGSSREMRKLGEKNTMRFLSGNVNPGQGKKEKEQEEEDSVSGARGTTKPPMPESESGESQSQNQKTTTTAVSKKSRLKQAVKEYGSTVIVFHVAMSLTSLGFCYLLISSGLDLPAIVQQIGFGESILKSSITQGASTFVIAYAVHKVFAPLRITITLTATPLIVRKLRTMGILKKPVP